MSDHKILKKIVFFSKKNKICYAQQILVIGAEKLVYAYAIPFILP